MNKPLTVLILILSITLFACRNNPGKTVPQKEDTTKSNETESIVVDQRKLYIIAPAGLSLRKENSLDSEKLAGMPLGAEVLLLEKSKTHTLEVEHIKGGMHKIRYNGTTGYAFNGYLSPIYLPLKDESTEAYIIKLKNTFPNITYNSKPTEPDFHEGTVNTYTLPASTWHEAFYVVKGIYDLPKSLGFPNPSGPDKESLQDPNKPEHVWSSGLDIERANDTLKKITYAYRAEGFGYSVDIIKAPTTGFQVTHLGFVD